MVQGVLSFQHGRGGETFRDTETGAEDLAAFIG